MTRFLVALSVSLGAALLSGCPSPAPSPVTPCPRGFCGGADAGSPIFPGEDAGIDFCGRGIGQTCTGFCEVPGHHCFEEQRVVTSVPRGDGSEPVEIVAFPGGMCSRECDVDEDCGWCGRCVHHTQVGRARIRGLLAGRGVCRPACESACPAGTGCDEVTGACVEACTSDEQCRISSVDTDGDGRDDELRYDDEGSWFCVAGACRDTPPPAFGGTCWDDSYCQPGYGCVRHTDGMRPGLCSRLQCSADTCGESAVCIVDPMGRTLCANRCVVGDDAPDQRVGWGGRGAGCTEGFACFPRTDDPSSREGACLPANYNDGSMPVGAACYGNGDCFSPYGRGECLIIDVFTGQGVCIVHDCVPGGAGLWPGIEVPEPPTICPTSDTVECVALGSEGGGGALCARTCESESDCADTWSCVRHRGVTLCSPSCSASTPCAGGLQCFSTSRNATCQAGDFDCSCR